MGLKDTSRYVQYEYNVGVQTQLQENAETKIKYNKERYK